MPRARRVQSQQALKFTLVFAQMTGPMSKTQQRRLEALEARQAGGAIRFIVRAVPCRKPGDPEPVPVPGVFVVRYPGGGLTDSEPATATLEDDAGDSGGLPDCPTA